MIDHLYINGCSYATGWGKGHEMSVTREKGMKSWVDHFAEKVSALEVWNHSLIGKPIGMSTIDTFGFCEEYYKKYQTFKDLFIVIEYTGPKYKLYPEIKVSTGDYKGEWIYPVSFMSGRNVVDFGPAGSSAVKWNTLWVRKNKSYLKPQEPEFLYVDRTNIRPEDIVKHEKMLNDWLMESAMNLMPTLTHSYTEIQRTQKYLNNRNIRYVMYWIGGVSPNHPDFKMGEQWYDQKYRKLYKNNRFIPMSTYTGTKATIEFSEKPFAGHPDATGHKRMADYLYNWVIINNLHKTPEIIQVTN